MKTEYVEKKAAISLLLEEFHMYWDIPCLPIDLKIQSQVCNVRDKISKLPSADVAPVRRERCDVCSGKAVLTQDAYNGYSLEIDAEQQEAAVWQGDECLSVFHIDFCPNCGANLDGAE